MMLVFHLHFAATLFMTGVIWFVQIVHYPLLTFVRAEADLGRQARSSRVTTALVSLPMLVEALTGAAFLRLRPFFMDRDVVWIGMALLGVIWLSTFLVQMPMQRRLARGFERPVHRNLVLTNWVRTLAWTARSVLLLWAAA